MSNSTTKTKDAHTLARTHTHTQQLLMHMYMQVHTHLVKTGELLMLEQFFFTLKLPLAQETGKLVPVSVGGVKIRTRWEARVYHSHARREGGRASQDHSGSTLSMPLTPLTAHTPHTSQCRDNCCPTLQCMHVTSSTDVC